MALPIFDRSSFRKAAAVGAMGMLAFMPAAGYADDAKVQQISNTIATPTATTTTAPYEFTVPWIDARNQDQTVVRFRAADNSTTGIGLVVYTNDPKMLEAANEAINDVRAQNVPAGLIVADGNSEMDIFIGGLQIIPGSGDPVPVTSENRNVPNYYRTTMKVALEAYQETMLRAHIDQQANSATSNPVAFVNTRD